MVSFRISLEVKSRVGAQLNENFSRCPEIQRSDTTSIKINGSKMFEEIRNTISAS